MGIKEYSAFNKDIQNLGKYAYTDKKIYSSRLVQQRITSEILCLIDEYHLKTANIIDIGCGDGTYTIELYKRLKPKKMLAIDPAYDAIKSAKSKNNNSKRIFFKVASIYDFGKIYQGKKYDIAIIRAATHHLDNPALAIRNATKLADTVVVLDPNGYNPILKIFEKTVTYHRQHLERSYLPEKINKWFLDNKFILRKYKLFNLIPMFFPKYLSNILRSMEPFVEPMPILKYIFCSQYLALYQKQ